MFKLATTKTTSHGFTLLEVLAITIIVGILAAIAAPSWFSFLQRQRLNVAQGEIYRAMQQAQQKGNQAGTSWQVSLRENGDRVEWAVHPADVGIASVSSWESLNSNVKVFTSKNDQGKCETTLNKSGNSCPSSPWSVQFDNKGLPSNLGQFALTTENSNKPESCIYISTMLGAMRTGEYHESPNDRKKHCY